MRTGKLLWVNVMVLTAAISVKAQDSAVNNEKNIFFAGVTYHSALNYYGRTDSLKSSGIYPHLGFTLKNGLFFNSTFVFIKNSMVSDYAATVLEAGYTFRNTAGNWSGTLSASRLMYKHESGLPQSAVKALGNFSVTNFNKVINITLGADAKFSRQTDFGVRGLLDHLFRIDNILGNDVIVLDPTAAVYAGSQNFTKTYYQNKNFLIFPVGQQEITENSKRFDILAYEFSFPVVYAKGKINLIFNPAYVIPQNLITVTDQSSVSEKGENMFYFTLSTRINL